MTSPTTITTEPETKAPVNSDPVAAARDAHEKAKANVETIRAKIMAGDGSVNASQLANAESDESFAALRITAAERNVHETMIASIVADSRAVQAEIDAYAAGDGKRLVAALKAAESAVIEFLKIIEDRRSKNADWQSREWEIRSRNGGSAQGVPGPLRDVASAAFVTSMLVNAARSLGLSDTAVIIPGNNTPALGFESAYQRLAGIDD